MSGRFKIVTQGCKVNQYESQAVREALTASGWVEEGGEPDLIVLNTCAVTARAEAKCRKLIRGLRRRHPAARFFIAGCGSRLARNRGRPLEALVGPGFLQDELPAPPARFISRFEGRHRAFLKVQDGCDSFCSFCVIPYLRGAPRSRPVVEVREEAERLAEGGYRELVLVGIHRGRYGTDLPGPVALEDLVEDLLSLSGGFRLRLSSIEPMEVSPRLIGLLASAKRICPHLHIPLQSGSDRILRRMNRHYRARDFLALTGSLRREIPGVALSTDVLAGFPGEEASDFRRTLRVVEAAGFSRLHCFPYSSRPGTAASSWEAPPRAEISRRMAVLEDRAARAARAYRNSRLGRDGVALWEGIDRLGRPRGTDEYYQKVTLVSGRGRPGTLSRVRVVGVAEDGCLVEPLVPSEGDAL